MPVDPTLTEPFVVGEDEVGGVAGIGGEAVAAAAWSVVARPGERFATVLVASQLLVGE